jgi:WD40 repeat protein
VSASGMVLPANRSISFPQNIVKTCDFSPNSRYCTPVDNEGILRVFDDSQKAPAWRLRRIRQKRL